MLDLRLYILGGLAFLAVASLIHLIVAIGGYLVHRVRARREHTHAVPGDAIEVGPEPILSGGPPPVLESDPFACETHAPTPAAPAASAEPTPVERVTPSPDEAERVAALLASLERQVEYELQARQPSIPAPEPRPAPTPPQAAPAPAPRSAITPAATAPPAAPAPDVLEVADIPSEYRLVAPVELHFTEGGGRIGVRPGTRTHEEFQRLARALLAELKDARSRRQQ